MNNLKPTINKPWREITLFSHVVFRCVHPYPARLRQSYWRSHRIASVQVNQLIEVAWRIFTSLSEPMLEYCVFVSYEQTSMKLWSKFTHWSKSMHFYFKNSILKYHMENDGHFISGSICSEYGKIHHMNDLELMIEPQQNKTQPKHGNISCKNILLFHDLTISNGKWVIIRICWWW